MNLILNLYERLGAVARRLAPFSVMAVFFLLGLAAIPLPAMADLKPPFFLMGLYYWSIYRPTLLPPWLAFACGMAADLLGGLPTGLNAAVFVAAQWIISDQRRFFMGQSFAMVWFGFFVLSALTSIAQWTLFGLATGAWVSLRPAVFSTALGLALFPLACVPLRWSHRMLNAPFSSLGHGA